MPDWLRQLTSSRGVLAVFGLAVALVPIWLLVHWASSPTYVPLFRELEWGEVRGVVDKLEGAGIDYSLQQGGSVVAVRGAELAQARVLLAEDGYGVGRPGMELFDRSSWGMTDFSQRVTYRRALEGELTRTIGRLRGVVRAQVHLALSEASPLRKLERPAEAAVVVSVGPGTVLSPEVVRGIAALVSNSVEHLTSDNVAILDDSGRLLSSVTDASSPVGLSNRQLELQRGVEEGLVAKAQGILTQVLGARNSRVQISADLNFEQVDQTVETFDPDGQVIASEERSESEPGAAGGPSGSSTIFHNTFLNSRRVDHIVGSVGGIKRLTVAVLLNEESMRASAAGNSIPPAVRMANLEALVRNAVGFDARRGDQITIVAIPFDTVVVTDVADLVAEPPSTLEVLPLIERFLPHAIAVLGIFVTFALARRVLSSVTTGSSQSTARAALPPSAAGSEEYSSLPPKPSEIQQLRQHVVDQTADLPNTAGQVVRAWLAEG